MLGVDRLPIDQSRPHQEESRCISSVGPSLPARRGGQPRRAAAAHPPCWRPRRLPESAPARACATRRERDADQRLKSPRVISPDGRSPRVGGSPRHAGSGVSASNRGRAAQGGEALARCLAIPARRATARARSRERVSMSGRMTDTPSAPSRPRVLVICSDRIGKRMAGPAIRAYELAKALRPHASEVMLAALETDAEPLEDVEVVQYHIRDQRRIKPLIARADVDRRPAAVAGARRLAAQLRRADRLRPLRPRAARGARVALAPQHAPAPRARHAHRRPRRRRAARRPPPDLRVGEAARPLARGHDGRAPARAGGLRPRPGAAVGAGRGPLRPPGRSARRRARARPARASASPTRSGRTTR